MAILSPDQRNYYYLLASERAGIHKPILAALAQAHGSPSLTDGETGLGVSPANRVALTTVNTLPQQIQYAADAIRSLTERLMAQGWKSTDFWKLEQGCYTDQFLQKVANGYAPAASEPTIARLEACNFDALLQAYRSDLETEVHRETTAENFAYLEQALLTFVERIPEYYTGLTHQRHALLEAVRIWWKLDTREATIARLVSADEVASASSDESILDIPLKQFVQQVTTRNSQSPIQEASTFYSGYPQQREALLRLVQLWHQLKTREEAIAFLKTNPSPEEALSIIDPALIAFVQQLGTHYQGQGSQRNALTEAFRLWHQLDSRATAVSALGINPDVLERTSTDRTAMVNLATQLDRELLTFVRRLPGEYDELDYQRDALIRLVQLWRNLPTKNQAIQVLIEDQKHLDATLSAAKDASPKPLPVVILKRPQQWTPETIQLFASIIEEGDFTWAEATCGGMLMPPNQAAVDAIIRIAKLAQQARTRIGRPFLVASWYRPPGVNRAFSGATTSRHLIGDAIDFTCEGLSGKQLYWFLDSWWPGGLARYTKFPNLCHIDARSYRARWRN